VVSGDPRPEELAALVAVLSTRSTEPVEKARRSTWNDPARLVRPPHAPGPGRWRESALPR
jgi:hypothetical protein